jgi:type IV pilus assembly protein PilB
VFGRRTQTSELVGPQVIISPPVLDSPPAGMAKLGEILMRAGQVSTDQLSSALAVQETDSRQLGAILVSQGVPASAVVTALSEQSDFAIIDLRSTELQPEALALVSAGIARRHSLLPVGFANGVLSIAISDPFDSDLLTELTKIQVPRIDLCLADRDTLRDLINLRYSDLDTVDTFVAEYTDAKPLQAAQTRRIEVDEAAPVAQVLNKIVGQALRDRASDVHIEPLDDRLRVRFRIDGALNEVLSLPSAMGSPLVSRLKILAEMNIVERRRPQDGQFTTSVDGRDLDVRVSTTATIFGEKAVLRLLDKSRSMRTITDLGMPHEAYVRYEEAIKSPYGMVLVTGPTGSGKTTTLYASLRQLNRGEINIMTIEDPVEYVFSGVNQIEINAQADVTFATGLKSILRQDPDIILVGEVRDQETARIAIQSALTGHLVLSSLHAVDCTSSLFRLLDMGIEPFLVTSAVTGIVAQRLVRKVCASCAEPYTPDAGELAFYNNFDGPAHPTFMAGKGCTFCSNTGYRERVGVYEVMTINDELRQALIAGAPPRDIRELAEKVGMRSLRTEALDLVGQGITTVAEVLRTVHMTA